MAIITRKGSPKLYCKFNFEGKQILRSLNTTDMKVALRREKEERVKATRAADAAREEAGKPKALAPAPTLAEFARLPGTNGPDDPGGVFYDWLSGVKKDRNLKFNCERIKSILKFKPLADATLDKINNKLADGRLLDTFQKEMNSRWHYAPQTQKKNMVVLSVILQKALEYDLIALVPKFMTFEDGDPIGIAISFEEEAVYMAAVDQDHRDWASIMINTGMEPGSAADLEWSDVHFGAVGKFTNGYIYDRCRKTKLRKRPLGMPVGLVALLKARWMRQGRPEMGPVFPSDRKGSDCQGVKHNTPLGSFQSAHKRLWMKTTRRAALPIQQFRPYDFRHTALTRAVQSGMSAFELQQLAGWASIRMADRYIHLDSTSRQIATDRLSNYLETEKGKRAAEVAELNRMLGIGAVSSN